MIDSEIPRDIKEFSQNLWQLLPYICDSKLMIEFSGLHDKCMNTGLEKARKDLMKCNTNITYFFFFFVLCVMCDMYDMCDMYVVP